MTNHFNLTIKGSVQGVSYRYHAKQKADELNLTGTCQNRSDGSVYIEVEGNAIQLEKFIRWCYDGPTFARVKDVVIEEGNLVGFDTFDIVG